jgi:hypothetical protein
MTQGADDQDWLAPSWVRRLGRLAELGSLNDPVKVRQRLLENLDAICDSALQKVRTYERRDGEKYDVPDPDLKTALGCQLAGARMLGVEGAVSIETKVDMSDLDELLKRAKRKLARVATSKQPEPEEAGDATH